MSRQFDHLDGSDPDEDRHLSRVTRRMRSSAWWHSVPRYEQPAPVAREMRAKTERGKRAVCALNRIAIEDVPLLLEIMDERTLVQLSRALKR